ncbi:MAG: hypothetical protein MZV70_48605 [Desulfobacterales bacterium]|nr:hypothetical protein [Desulfobacterales bacterium]
MMSMFPSTGSKNSASVEYTGGPLMGDVSYTRYGVDLLLVFPPAAGYGHRRPRTDRHDPTATKGQRERSGLRTVLFSGGSAPPRAPVMWDRPTPRRGTSSVGLRC